MKKITSLFAVLAMMLAVGTAQAQSTNCSMTITIKPYYSYSWNGWQLDVYQGNVLRGSATLGSFDTPPMDVPIPIYAGADADSVHIVINGENATSTYGYLAFDIADGNEDKIYGTTSYYYVSPTYDGDTLLSYVPTQCASCKKPTMNSISSTSSSITASWTANGDVSQFVYGVAQSGSMPTTWIQTTYTSATIDGLEGDTEYEFFVRGYCGVGDTSLAVSMATFTLCAPITVMDDTIYTENFEHYISSDVFGEARGCLTPIEQCGYTTTYSSYVYPKISTNIYYNTYDYMYANGSRGIQLNPSYGNSSFGTVPISVPINQLEVVFYAGGSGTLQVGYNTTPDDIETFVLVESIYFDNSYNWKPYCVPFNEVDYDGEFQVVFRADADPSMDQSTMRGILIDDIVLRRYQSCPQFFGDIYTESHPYSGEVMVRWTHQEGINTVQVVYGKHGFDPNGSEASMISVADADSVIVTGLDDDETYDFYVRAQCEDGNGLFAPWYLHTGANAYFVDKFSDTITACEVTLLDDGGWGLQSTNAGTTQVVVRSEDGVSAIQLKGWLSLYMTSSSYGKSSVTIYDGEGTGGEVIFFHNNGAIDDTTITSKSPALTLAFYNYGGTYYRNEGFEFRSSCVEPQTCFDPILVHGTVDGASYDLYWGYPNVDIEPEGFTIELKNMETGAVSTYTADAADRTLHISGLAERTDYTVSITTICDFGGLKPQSVAFRSECINGGVSYVGDATSTTSTYNTPLYYSNGTVEQTIYHAADLELNIGDTITGLRFDIDKFGYSNDYTSYTYSDVDLYIHFTDQENYGTTYSIAKTSYVLPSTSDLAYSGEIAFTQGEVHDVYLDNPIVYTGDNIVLTAHVKSGGGYNGYPYYRSTSVDPERRAVYVSGSSLDPTDLSTITSTSSYMYGNVQFGNINFLSPCGDPSCVRPNHLVVTDLTYNSISLDWEDHEDDKWDISYREVGGDWVVAAEGISNSEYQISNLNPGTSYEVMITTQCESGGASKKYAFNTECHGVSVPYMQDFEHLTMDYNAPTPLCYDRFTYSAASNGYPYVYDYNAYEGNNCLYYYTPNPSTYFALPEMEDAVNTLQIGFYAYINSSYDTMVNRVEVGVLEGDPFGYNCVPVDTIRVLAASHGYDFYYADLDKYEGTGNRIYIRNLENTVYIDNLEIIKIPACTRMQSASVVNFSNNSMVIRVEDDLNRSQYEVYYGLTNDMNAASHTTLTANSERQVTLTGLTSGQTYYIWVAARCEGISEPSPAISLGAVSLYCDPIVVTNTEDFVCGAETNEEVACLRQTNRSGSLGWSVVSVNDLDNYGSSAGYIAYSGEYSLLCDNFYSGNDGRAMLVMPAFDFSGLTENDAELSFHHYTVVGNIKTDVSLRLLYRTSLDGQWNEIRYMDSLISKKWSTYFVDLPDSKGVSFYQIAFDAATVKSYPSSLHYLDDIRVGNRSECRPPLDFSIANLNEHEVTIKWDHDGYAQHRVQYRISSSIGWTGVTADADSLVIVPLVSNMEYQVRVASLCGDNDEVSEYTIIKTFVTPPCSQQEWKLNQDTTNAVAVSNAFVCPTMTSTYTEIFISKEQLAGMSSIDAIAIHQAMPITYEYALSNTNLNVYIRHTDLDDLDSSFHYEKGENVLTYTGKYMVAYPDWVTLNFSEPFNWNGHDNVIISFYVSTYSSYSEYADGPLQHYAHSVSGNKVQTVTMDQTIALSDVVKAKTSQITFSNMMPDIRLMSCTPICFPPTYRRTVTAPNSLTVYWVNEGSSIDVSIKEHGASTYDLTKTVNNVNNITFDQLTPNSMYDIRLRRNCSAQGIDNSNWIEVTVATDTACSIPDNFKVEGYTATTATFSFDGGDIANRWELRVWNQGFDTTYQVSGSPFTATGLRPNSSYDADIRAYCGASDKVVGDYTGNVKKFNNTCPQVTGLTAVSLANGDVKVDWAAGNGNTKWIVGWRIKGTSVNEMIEYHEVSTNSYTISGLKKGFTYTVSVRSVCSEGWNSDWVSGVNVDLVGIDDVEGGDVRFSLQPNPATDRVSLQLDQFDGEATVSILSVDGREVNTFTTTEANTNIDLKGFATGTYFVRVKTAEWMGVHKLIVK